MKKAYIGLGSNVGDRKGNLQNAVDGLRKTDGIYVTKISSIYETDPVGFTEQPDFLNAVVEVETRLEPRELLKATKAIEKRQGRVRGVKWGPRPIDLDILLYGDIALEEEGLVLPHPAAVKRAFVLTPLAEIAAEKKLPDGRTVLEISRKIGDAGVRLYDGKDSAG